MGLAVARAALALAVLVAASTPTCARERSSSAVREFKRLNPCPSTGQRRGACPGYIVDHVDPLCHGGADRPSNMQWQTVADAKVKDRWERRLCRSLRASQPRPPTPE